MFTISSSAVEWALRLHLLEVKDRDLRISVLEQARTAVDRGVHIGGAFSCLVPLTALYYGGVMEFDPAQPTKAGQDLFILSKGHGVAAMASVYADLGIINPSLLAGSRSWTSILNGHPGPLLPGVHTATGPMGQGIAVAEGLALAARLGRHHDVFTITGDGELQEGSAWEAVMYSGDKGLSNLCVIVDNNRGQLDDPTRLHLEATNLTDRFASFGWNAVEVDGTGYAPVLEALRAFKEGIRHGKPTAIISRTRKGHGGLSVRMQSHKAVLDDDAIDLELSYQRRLRAARVADLNDLLARTPYPDALQTLRRLADSVRLDLRLPARATRRPRSDDDEGASEANSDVSLDPRPPRYRGHPAPPREKRIAAPECRPADLDGSRSYTSDEVVSHAMATYARDPRVVSVDADLSVTSGLQRSVAQSDVTRALNVGVAEANMMSIGEAFAILGHNVWVSTFCPFFNWNVLRRIAVSQQERLEVMASEDGWLTAGHGLDLTFLATAPDFETKTNGATHMGIDDVMALGSVAHLRIITASCPQQLLAIIRWIMDGDRGLVYLRMMRGAAPVLYGPELGFEFARAYTLREADKPQAIIVSSGREIHEALKACDQLASEGVRVKVVDMPSLDPVALSELAAAEAHVVIPEQNNGIIADAFYRHLARNRCLPGGRFVAINTRGCEDQLQFVHSGTYDELVEAFGLSAERLRDSIRMMIRQSV